MRRKPTRQEYEAENAELLEVLESIYDASLDALEVRDPQDVEAAVESIRDLVADALGLGDDEQKG